MPPSTAMVAPCTCDASSLARNAATAATSDTSDIAALRVGLLTGWHARIEAGVRRSGALGERGHACAGAQIAPRFRVAPDCW